MTQHTVQRLPLKLAIFIGLCLLPGLGAAHLALSGVSPVPLLLYPLASAITAALYGYDKRQARRQGSRIPEKVLHMGELCGGWPGALLAQQLLRHKTRKLAYQVPFWLIVALHQALWLTPLLLAWQGS
ncbi:DUF1294 domain-containing protein [Pseudomonas cremoricolorata]|uniref:Membrane protein n=1 Tax=Pseudomonas cremoricolorata TaxID=157783 RepID=A0A089WWK6_9PSED|nr:DUF1294 domain-containing protein [Pseudomonas cremoricolorata]AIR90997.1 membrane protein [Pseudomonas cremoricolorata]